MMKGIYLLLGSNLGIREEIISSALESIEKTCGPILNKSHLYESASWGLDKQPDFLNQVVEIETNLDPLTLLEQLLDIEKSFGRKRNVKWGSRSIDIDILYYGDQISMSPRLTVPHPQIAYRRFTLVPLAEILPHFIHPLLNKTHRQLLEECEDQLWVRKFVS